MSLPQKNTYRVDEIADYWSVTRKTIYSWIKKGILETKGKGTNLRILRQSLLSATKLTIPADLTSTKYIMRSLNNRISCGINGTIRGHCYKRDWERIVGFTAEQLKEHLEKQFARGMSWEKFMAGKIHIDHIIPKVAFHFETTEDVDFKKCWCLENLQPLWARENIQKKDKLKYPFQPSLLLKI